MNKLSLALLFALSPSLSAASAAEPVSGQQFIETFAKIFGEHKGERKGHAKGFCATGTFNALPSAADFNQISWLSQQPVPVVARFSMAGGNPKAAENSRSPRGLALQLKTADGQLQHFALLSTPVFGAKDPQTFLGLLQSQIPDSQTGKVDVAKVQAFRAAHPDTLAQAEFLAKTAPPWSYATTAYFGLHTFFIRDNQGQTQKIRWQFVPEDGIKGLSDAEMKATAQDFLQQRLQQRLSQGPIRWTLQFVFGEASDTAIDPSQAWPKARKTVDIGKLTIEKAGSAECVGINFDPNVLSTGISPSADPILKIRSVAYAISFGQRLSGQ